MPENRGLRQRLERFVGRSRSPLRDGTADPGKSAGTTSGPSDPATSTTTPVINPTSSLAAPRTVVTPSSQSPGEVSLTGAPTAPAQLASSQSRFGLFQLTTVLSEEELSRKGPDIVAIHGITGGYERTWTHSQGALWLRDFLPKDLPVPTRVFSFGYDAQVKFSVSKAKLEDFARSLLQALNRVRRGKVCSPNFILIVKVEKFR